MMGVSAQETSINVAIAVWEWPSYFSPEARMRGIRLKTSNGAVLIRRLRRSTQGRGSVHDLYIVQARG